MTTLLFKPFEKYSEKTLLLVGLSATVLGSFLAYTFSARFDGVLDLHIVNKLTFYESLLDGIINISCLTLFLFISAKYINTKTRFVDILTTVMISRIPMLVLPLANIDGSISDATEEIIQLTNPKMIEQISVSTWPVIIGFGIVSILFVVWYIALLYNGYKVASNAKSKAPIVIFILAIVLAETLSKFLVFQFN